MNHCACSARELMFAYTLMHEFVNQFVYHDCNTYIYIYMCVCKEEFEHAYDHARVNEACASAYTLIVHVFVSFCAYMLYTMMHIVTYLRRKAYCARTQSRMYVSMYIFTHACMNVFLFKPACAFDVGFMFRMWIVHA